MIRSKTLLLAAALLVAGSTAAQTPSAAERVEALVQRGDAAFHSTGYRRTTWKAIGFYREAIKLDPAAHAALWRTARAFCRLAEDERGAGRNGSSRGKQGLDYALRAIKAAPMRVEGHYWAAVSVGQYGNGMGVLSALHKGIAGRFRKHLKRALKLDPSYDLGGVYRMLAMYHHSMPWPMKDNRKALSQMRLAQRYGSRATRHYYCQGQIVTSMGRKEEARRLYRRCLVVDGGGEDRPTVRDFKSRCRQLLKDL